MVLLPSLVSAHLWEKGSVGVGGSGLGSVCWGVPGVAPPSSSSVPLMLSGATGDRSSPDADSCVLGPDTNV